MNGRLTWRNEPDETGLRSVGQRPRGRIVKVDGVDVLSVSPSGGGWARDLEGWYFVFSHPSDRKIASYNSLSTAGLFPTREAAQAAATAWYKARP